MENSPTRNYEARRAPSDCWAESNSKETNYDQRRENKWYTRWGPDDKDTDGLCEKWIDSGRDGDIPFGKDEREDDHYRLTPPKFEGGESLLIICVFAVCPLLFFSRVSIRETSPYKKADEMPISRELALEGNTSSNSGTPWRAPSLVEQLNTVSHDWRDASGDFRSRAADMAWNIDEAKWQTDEDPIIKRQPSAVLGFSENSSGDVPALGVDGWTDLHLLAKKMALERQRSLSCPCPYWPGRDAPSMVSKSEVHSDSPMQHAKPLSSFADNPFFKAYLTDLPLA
ncbi:hypothetical protein D5086_027080 [Populus alba]|uniref:Uncharacterized protein n=1 Tax=Populus alba TaxID=43335 RepID=A0ACC4B4C2_POPAL